MNCKNCGHTVDGNFCSTCGQSSKVDRINLPNFLHELSESLFQVNKGFLYTLSALFVRPGSSLRDYIHGKRQYHFKPIPYVLTLSTLYILIVNVTHQNSWMNGLLSGWMAGASGGHTGESAVPTLAAWFATNYEYSTLLLLPVFSVASYVSFYTFRNNYLEHLVMNVYIAGQQAIFYSLFAVIGNFIKNEIIEMLPFLLAMAYTVWVWGQFFSESNRILLLLRALMAYLLYWLCSIGLLAGLVAIR